MLGLLMLFVVGSASAVRPPDEDIPPYVQARAAFAHSRLYLQKRVPQEESDITNVNSRRNLAFGILADVTANIAEDNERATMLDILQREVPWAWQNYKEVARIANRLLAEAQAKIQPITSLIDALCRTTDSIENCNIQVQDKVKSSDQFVKNRARLLVLLGRASFYLKKHESELDAAAADFTVVPYLIKRVNSSDYKALVKELYDVLSALRTSGSQ